MVVQFCDKPTGRGSFLFTEWYFNTDYYLVSATSLDCLCFVLASSEADGKALVVKDMSEWASVFHEAASAKYNDTSMRSKENITKYVDMMAKLVQAFVTSNAFKKNQSKHPFSDWVTVSDDAFLISCRGNYEMTCCAVKHSVNNGSPPPSKHEEEEPIAEPHDRAKLVKKG